MEAIAGLREQVAEMAQINIALAKTIIHFVEYPNLTDEHGHIRSVDASIKQQIEFQKAEDKEK